MKHKCFRGIAVHSARVCPTEPTIVGVWLGQNISSQQRERLKGLKRALEDRGHSCALRTNAAGNTALKFFDYVWSPKDARAIALCLARAVTKAIGVQSILRQLPNYRAVSRALAS